MSRLTPIEAKKLKFVLHEKIEQMEAKHLLLLNRVLLEIEAEDIADRLNHAFDEDRVHNHLHRTTEMMTQFRLEHPYT